MLNPVKQSFLLPSIMKPLAAATLICAGNFSNARADEVLKFRAFAHAVSAHTEDVNDVEGHVLGLARTSGLVALPDGSVGTINWTATIDSIKGTYTYLVYHTITFNDGSVLSLKATGLGRPEGTTTVFPPATVNVVGGKGRFAGAKGDGTLSGARIGPFGTGADLYLDFVVNVKN